ncbi:MAG: hypothetical protein JNJ46_21930 [Myxococcales bacterium]|nr:hypothetical protein [Myxococcales bacterium]
MRNAYRYTMLCLGLAGCLDLSVLQSGANPPDMALPMDMATPDMAAPPVDMAPVDMAPGDMATPFAWASVTPGTAPAKLYGISGVASGGTNIYVVGASATVVKSTNGTQFAAAAAPATGAMDFTSLWVQDANNLYVADANGRVFVSTDGATAAGNWSDKGTGSLTPQRAIFGRSGAGASVLVAGDDTTRALLLTPITAPSWSTTATACTGGVKSTGVWASSSYYLIVGEGFKAAKGTNPATACTQLSNMDLAGSPNFVAASGVDDQNAYLLTADGQLGHTDLTAANDKMFRRGRVNGATFTAMWVRNVNEVWVVGSQGGNPKVWQWQSGSMNMTDRTGTLSAGGYTLTGIWGDGAGGLWIIGNNGTNGAIFKH